MGIATTSALGAASIAIIGAANIVGTLAAGWLGKWYSKKYLLALIYTGRTVAAALFILFPVTPTTVIVFSVAMGSLWLATVPLTSGLVAYIYGLRYMGTLYGIVFLSHQLGSFVGVWLGDGCTMPTAIIRPCGGLALRLVPSARSFTCQ